MDGGRKYILLAEDDRVNRMLALTILERAGYRVDTVENGLQAIQALRSRSYDLVLMDLIMPEMNGFQTAREIRRLSSPRGRVPIIALTAYDQPQDLDDYRAAAINDYVIKPLNRNYLLSVLNRWLSMGACETVGASACHIPTQNVLDLETLHRLEQDTEPTLLKRVIGLFISDTQTRLATIKADCAAAEWQRLQREAHTLKSGAGAFGAKALQEHARRLDQACLQGHYDTALALADGLVEVALPALEALARRYHNES